MENKKFAIVLSGSGVFDGAEIHEATMAMLAIVRNNCSYQIFAPDVEQLHVVNHLNGEVMDEKRNVLVESARIARGNIKPLSEYKSEDYDALLFPGGFGVAKNLCTLAIDGANCSVNKETEEVIKTTHSEGKPIGALCISPVLITKVLGEVEVTIGNDKGTVETIQKMGGKHTEKGHTEVVIDEKHKVVTTPCYMLDASIAQIADGAENLVKEVIKLMK